MSAHFKKHGDEYLLSPAACLLMVADAIRSPDAGPAGKERSIHIISQVMEVARRMKFQKSSKLETMLLFGAEPAPMLALCDELVAHIGGWAVVAILRRAAASRTPGDVNG